jgi:hypothetical protein
LKKRKIVYGALETDMRSLNGERTFNTINTVTNKKRKSFSPGGSFVFLNGTIKRDDHCKRK